MWILTTSHDIIVCTFHICIVILFRSIPATASLAWTRHIVLVNLIDLYVIWLISEIGKFLSQISKIVFWFIIGKILDTSLRINVKLFSWDRFIFLYMIRHILKIESLVCNSSFLLHGKLIHFYQRILWHVQDRVNHWNVLGGWIEQMVLLLIIVREDCRFVVGPIKLLLWWQIIMLLEERVLIKEN